MPQYPDLLKPQSSRQIVLPSGREVELPVASPLFSKWTYPLPADTYNKKPVLEFNGEMMFAELAILRIFELDGWEGRWVDSYRHKYRIGYWGDDVTKDLPATQPAIPLWNSIRATASCAGGCFDLFCWREASIIFAEAKWRTHDKIRVAQQQWLEAALDSGISHDSFLIVEWDFDSPKTGRSRPPLPKELQLSVFRRDGWMCRWCSRPVIFPPVMRFLEREARSSGRVDQLSYYHPHWTRDGAPLLDELGAVIDHIEAYSAGGAHREENLATACNKCNAQKSSRPVAEWNELFQKKTVKGKYGEPQHWDGFSTLFAILAQRDPIELTVSEKEWLKALDSVPVAKS
jgi:5-methylcytosine-specific restriction endonuclease McrA